MVPYQMLTSMCAIGTGLCAHWLVHMTAKTRLGPLLVFQLSTPFQEYSYVDVVAACFYFMSW